MIEWKMYDVRWEFPEKLCGSVPMKKELVRPWLESRMKGEEVPEEVEKEVLETLDDEQEKVTLGFQKDEMGLFVRGGTVKAHLKDCANQVKDCLKIKNLRSKLANAVYVENYRIYLQRNGNILQDVDGTFDQPIHVITPRGPRNSLKTISYVEGVTLRFVVKMIPHGEVTLEVLDAVLEYGGMHGYLGERGMGEGRYQFDIQPLIEE